MIREDLIDLLKKKGFEGKVDHPSVEKFGDYAVRADVNIYQKGSNITGGGKI